MKKMIHLFINKRKLEKEIPAFLSQFVSSERTLLEEELQIRDFVKQLVFLTHITNRLN